VLMLFFCRAFATSRTFRIFLHDLSKTYYVLSSSVPTSEKHPILKVPTQRFVQKKVKIQKHSSSNPFNRKLHYALFRQSDVQHNETPHAITNLGHIDGHKFIVVFSGLFLIMVR